MKKVLLALSLITAFVAVPAEARRHGHHGYSHSNREYRNVDGREVRSPSRRTFGGFASTRYGIRLSLDPFFKRRPRDQHVLDFASQSISTRRSDCSVFL